MRERAAGVVVDRQALAGVEQLHQQAGVGAVGARRAPGRGSASGLASIASLRIVPSASRLRPSVGGAPRGGGRADPVLGPAVLALRLAAQRVDARAALVEAVELVGREQDRFHALLPDPRWTSCVGIVTVRGGPSSPSSRANASAAPCSPSFHGSARTTVVPSRSASSKSSKPASATGFGVPASACSAPIVLRLLAVKSAVGVVGHLQQPRDGGPGGGDVAVAGLQQGRVLREAGGGERLAVAGDALAHRVELGVVGDAGDPRVAVGDQVLDRAAGAAEVVEQHGVGLDPVWRAVEEDGARGRREVAVIGAGGDDQQRVDAPAQQRRHELPLALGVLAGGGGDEEEAAVARGCLDRLGDGGVERVGDVLDHEPERRGGAAVAQRGGEVVALEAELGDRRRRRARRSRA